MDKMSKKPCCYFYIDANGNVAYVGKANGSLVGRVRSHALDDRFIKYSPTYTIKYLEFDTPGDMDVAGMAFIKSLNPPLNIQGKTYGYFPKLDVDISTLKTFIPPRHYIGEDCSDIQRPDNIDAIKDEVLEILKIHNGRDTFKNISDQMMIFSKNRIEMVRNIWMAVEDLVDDDLITCKNTGVDRGGRPTFFIRLR